MYVAIKDDVPPPPYEDFPPFFKKDDLFVCMGFTHNLYGFSDNSPMYIPLKDVTRQNYQITMRYFTTVPAEQKRDLNFSSESFKHYFGHTRVNIETMLQPKMGGSKNKTKSKK
jgi:hypothetical protein